MQRFAGFVAFGKRVKRRIFGSRQLVQKTVFVGALQRACCGNHVVFGQRYFYIKCAIFAKKLALVKVRHRVPAFAVIHGRLWIPLRNLVGLRYVSAARKRIRQFDFERRGYRDFFACFYASRQTQNRNIGIERIYFKRGFFALYHKIQALYIAFFLFF